ncbi:MAG: vWA domain-containing protein [Chloroflexota bacterium]
MTLLAPLALFLALAAVPIVLMYVLKPRRPEQEVPSTLLWRRAFEDVQASAPWQRLRPNLLLLLQLLVLAALVLVLAHPAYSQTRTFTGDVIVIVDQSPAMQATDVSPSRFAAAIERAHTVASQLSADSVMSVIGMGAQPRLIVDESTDRRVIDRGIDSLRPGVGTPNISASVSIASSLARDGEPTRVIVLTSRDSGIRVPSQPYHFGLQVIRLGGRLHDLAIAAFQASRIPRHTEAMLTIKNFGVDAARADLNLYADGQLADVRPLSIAPGQQQDLFWTQLPAGINQLQARLAIHDDMVIDKRAQVVLPSASIRSVLLVTRGNPWLTVALQLDRSLRVVVERPQEYAPAQSQGFDLVVFDGLLPHILPSSGVLLVAPGSGSSNLLRFGRLMPAGAVSSATIPAADGRSSILQYVDLSDVHVANVRRTRLPHWLLPLALARDQTVLAVGEHDGSRLAVMPFNLQRSDWPLRISFPIVIHNLVEYLAPALRLSTVNVTAGEAVGLTVGGGVREIDVSRPDGGIDRLHPPFGTFVDTAAPGVYTVREVGAETRSATFASNLSAVRGAPAPGPETIQLGALGSHGGPGRRVPADVAWLAALAALGLLSLEWWYAWRR